MKHRKILVLLTLLFSAVHRTQPAIDNRYLPLFNFDFQHKVGRRSVLNSNVFITFGHEGYVDMKGSVPLPELFGKYDMYNAAQALVAVGKPNPLPTSWWAYNNLIWDMKGKFQSEGLWLALEQYLGKDLSIGFKVPFMHIDSQLEFLQTDELRKILGLGLDGSANLYNYLNQVNSELGFSSYQWRGTNFGDLDLYLRWGTVQDYILKCKHVDVSLKVGALVPMGDQVVLDNPSAITYGYYNHFGIYFEGDFNFEVKDDWKVGFWLNTTQRFAKTQLRRIPVSKELPQWGALVANVFVDPGLTIGFAPYLWLEDIRNGFGVRGSFRFIWHEQDYWGNPQIDGNVVVANLAEVIKFSGWSMEYFTASLVYDLQQNVSYERNAPYLYLDCDIPVGIFNADLVSKPYRLTFGFEFNF